MMTTIKKRQLILLDDYTAVEEDKILICTVIAIDEDIRFMQHGEKTLHHDLVILRYD